MIRILLAAAVLSMSVGAFAAEPTGAVSHPAHKVKAAKKKKAKKEEKKEEKKETTTTEEKPAGDAK